MAALEPVSPSSCMVQARWGWSDHVNSGRYGTQFQAYRLSPNYIPAIVTDPYSYGFEVIVTRSKLRGHGRALSLYISSESGKDMHLLGWTVDITGESD